MARPRMHSHKMSGFYVKPAWAAQLDKIARESGRTTSDVLRESLVEYFKKRRLPI